MSACFAFGNPWFAYWQGMFPYTLGMQLGSTSCRAYVLTSSPQNLCSWGQSNSAVSRALAFHAADQVQTSATPEDVPRAPPGVLLLNAEPGISAEHCWVWPQNNQKRTCISNKFPGNGTDTTGPLTTDFSPSRVVAWQDSARLV